MNRAMLLTATVIACMAAIPPAAAADDATSPRLSCATLSFSEWPMPPVSKLARRQQAALRRACLRQDFEMRASLARVSMESIRDRLAQKPPETTTTGCDRCGE
jgi:hypothetical protein